MFQVRLSHKNYSRYIYFNRSYNGLGVLIYGDGNVVIELNEICHDDFRELIFEYTTESENSWNCGSV